MEGITKILFPTDFSENADHALLTALPLAGFTTGELIVQHVVHNFFEKYPHSVSLSALHELQNELDGYVEAHIAPILRGHRETIRIVKVISQGEPAKQIAELADSKRVDLVIMGAANGVFTNAVMRLTNRPVLAVSLYDDFKSESRLNETQTILVATDFSPHSERVIRYAFALKKMFDARIYMLHVLESAKLAQFGIRRKSPLQIEMKMREWAHNQLLNLTPDEFVHDPTVIRLVEVGSASDKIADTAALVGADITIVGTHAHVPMHKRVAGTTINDLLNEAATSVLAVKL
jgi:nucleotide-binding universal stress UspA family protein